MYDGLPSSISTYTQDVISSADLSIYDRIEVVRGATDPMTDKNYEIGLKGEYFDGALNASVALFEMEQENRAYLLDNQNQSNCPSFPATSCYGAAGKVRSRGIDTELTGASTSTTCSILATGRASRMPAAPGNMAIRVT